MPNPETSPALDAILKIENLTLEEVLLASEIMAGRVCRQFQGTPVNSFTSIAHQRICEARMWVERADHVAAEMAKPKIVGAGGQILS